jgi:Fatty acid desaturase
MSEVAAASVSNPLTGRDPREAPTLWAPMQKLFGSWLYEPRDAIFVWVALRAFLVVAPIQVALYFSFSWWLAAGLWALQIGWMAPPVILMLHNTMHRPFFKKMRLMNRVVPYSMSALFGIPTGYMEHHVGMHHAENNLAGDLSSTMGYQRDNIFHWLMYVSRFLFRSHVELVQYMVKKKRTPMAVRAISSDVVHMAVMALLCAVHWQATVAAFVVPYFLIRLAMMWGNWGQHAFVDSADPGNSLKNSITCVNSLYNRRCFNDGYHIGHHVKQNRHWTDMPQDFDANMALYVKEGAIIFDGVDFFMVSLFLFLRRYDWLANCFVRLPGDTRSKAEVEEFLRSRTKQFTTEEVLATAT